MITLDHGTSLPRRSLSATVLLALLIAFGATNIQRVSGGEYESAIKFFPQVAMDATGNFVLVWSDFDHVFAQRHDFTGAPQGDVIQVHEGIPTENIIDPDFHGHTVSMDNSGRFVIAWESSPRSREIHFRLYDAAGSMLAELTQSNKINPSVALDPTLSTFLLTCRDLLSSHIVAQYFNIAGEPTSGVVPVTPNGVHPWESDIAIVNPDFSAIVFEETRRRDEVILAGLGDPTIPEVIEYPRFSDWDAQNPAIAADSTGRIAVVWEEKIGGYSQRRFIRLHSVLLAFFRPNGIVEGEPIEINPGLMSQGPCPDIIFDRDDNVVVVFTALREGIDQIYSVQYDVAEKSLGEPLWVNEDVDNNFRSMSPSIDRREDGSYVVAWETFVLDAGGEFDESELHFRIFDRTDDGDLDGITNALDNCLTDYNPGQTDLDKDGTADACDDDLDGDSVSNADDNCPAVSNGMQEDVDGDGFGDVCDNCPQEGNEEQADFDRDGIGDECDPCSNDMDNDEDGDGICHFWDNCPTVPNQDQVDQDRDWIGDACDNCVSVKNNDQLDANGNGTGDHCEPFIRGDANFDGVRNVADASFILAYLFLGGASICMDANDTNDNGAFNITDAIFLLDFLFRGGAPIPEPLDQQGIDPTADPLGCEGL